MPDTGSYKSWMHRYRRSLISVGTVAVLFALIIALIPRGIQYAMVAWFEGDNERSAIIENVDFNPFTGELLVEGLKVEEPAGRRLELPRVFLDVELSKLFNKRVQLRSFEMQGGFVEVLQTKAGQLRLAGLPEPAKPKEPQDAPSSWQVGANSIAIESLQIRFHDRGSQESFGLNKLQITNIAQWQTDAPAEIDTTLMLGDASARIAGKAFLFAPTPSVDAKLTIKSLDLARFKDFTAGTALKEITGVISGGLDFQGKIEASQKISLDLKGSLDVDALSASLKETRMAGPSPIDGATRAKTEDVKVEERPRPETRVSLGRGRIADLTAKLSLNQGIAEAVEVTGDMQVENLGVDSSQFKFANKSLRWTGKLVGSMGASGAASLRATGNFNSSDGDLRLGLENDRASSMFSVGGLVISNLVSEIKRSKSGDIDAEMTVEVGLGKLQGTAAEAVLKNEEIRWKGQLGATIDAAGKMATRAVGEFNSRLLQLNLPVAGLKVSQASTRWKGQIDYRQESTRAKPELSLGGIAETAGIRVDLTELGLRLLSLGSLVLDGAEAKGLEDIRISRIVAQGLETVQQLPSDSKKANGAEPYVAFRGALTANDLTVKNGSEVRLKQVLLDGGNVQIERLENGELRLVGSLLNLIGQWGAGEKEQKDKDSKPLRVQIDEWTITGNSRLALTDRSVKPAAKFAIIPVEVRLKNIDTAEPDKNVPIELTAKLGKYSNLDFKGSFRPFSDRLNLDVAGKITGFDLTSVSGYSSEYMGYDLTRGRMDADILTRIIEGKLQTESKLTISKLQVQPTDPKLLDPLKKRLQVPLETALSLLRNSKDVIRLNVPVTGDITSPKFDFSDAINKAIGNAMKKTVVTTLKIAFPLGGIIVTMAEVAGGGAKLRLNPVSFAAGSAELSASAKADLSKVAELLRSRPAVKISICGWATTKDQDFLIDRDFAKAKAAARKTKGVEPPKGQVGKDPKAALADAALRDQINSAAVAKLPELGKQRGETAKDHLIKQFNIPEARLFLCAPKVSKEADAQPRVEIFL